MSINGLSFGVSREFSIIRISKILCPCARYNRRIRSNKIEQMLGNELINSETIFSEIFFQLYKTIYLY